MGSYDIFKDVLTSFAGMREGLGLHFSASVLAVRLTVPILGSRRAGDGRDDHLRTLRCRA